MRVKIMNNINTCRNHAGNLEAKFFNFLPPRSIAITSLALFLLYPTLSKQFALYSLGLLDDILRTIIRMKLRKHEGSMSNDAKIAVLETTISHIHEALERIDKRFDSIDRKFDKIDRKFDKVDEEFKLLSNKMDTRFDQLNNRIWTLFFWMIGGFASMLGILIMLFIGY